MKKIITATCFAVAALGFSATSALAAKNVSKIEAPGASSAVMQKNAFALNTILADRKVINLSEWSDNIRKIATAQTTHELQAIHDQLYYKIMTSSL